MRNIKLNIEYDGTRYSGWQRQLNGRSIQGEIESSLHSILQEKVNVIGAGRTDAGVHARGQVANFQTKSAIELYKIKSALNGALAEDIVIHDVEDEVEDFHARYNAKQRVYKYYIRQSESALERLYSWHLRYELDIERMQEVAQVMLGEHDFEGFSKVGSDVKHYICNVATSCWHQQEKRLTYTVAADRFLRGMVRAFVGTMVDAGRGLISLDVFKEQFEKKLKYEPRTAAPAHGLVLEKVFY